jgi:hypothetical protein
MKNVLHDVFINSSAESFHMNNFNTYLVLNNIILISLLLILMHYKI